MTRVFDGRVIGHRTEIMGGRSSVVGLIRHRCKPKRSRSRCTQQDLSASGIIVLTRFSIYHFCEILGCDFEGIDLVFGIGLGELEYSQFTMYSTCISHIIISPLGDAVRQTSTMVYYGDTG